MNKWLWMMLSMLVVLPMMAKAEVYKWVDKDGVVRYSDTPPPSNIKLLPVNGKKPVGVAPPVAAIPTEGAEGETPTAAAAPTAGAAPVAPTGDAGAAPVSGSVDAKKKPIASPEADAIKRQKEAEVAKKKDAAKQAELEQRQKDCATAKSNYDLYKTGGRIAKVNDKGERVYLGDADIATGLAQAQKNIDLYCN